MNQDLRRMAEELLSDGDLNSLMAEAPYITEYPATCREFAYQAIAAALAKLTQQEPVASIRITEFGSGNNRKKAAHVDTLIPIDQFNALPNGTRLYTIPTPSQQEERKPLTREQASEMWRQSGESGSWPDFIALVRRVESAHNIKEQQ